MRLKKIKEEYGDKVDIQYRVFMLRPEPDPSAVFNDYRRAGWTRAGAGPDSGDFHLWESGDPFPNCSLPSAEAGIAVRNQGPEAWERFHLSLLRAFFTENRNISDKAVILDVAEKSGVDADLVRDALESGTYRRQAFDEYTQAVQQGISGIPSVVVNDQAVLVGAVPPEQYRYVIDSILKTGELPGRGSGELPVL
ncbi:MAG: DsbA family protein [Candidatus Tectomicrobia bacterium]|uniref:DsbA family protein n=1 Tax=Tectimicrobiota bacterium TaxID=2528274 RepID=A0A932I2J2_UNCTE|nr:DsbA family protein [Candidatus Tectomicrobia bacterium]